MHRFFTKHYWRSISDKARTRLGRPRVLKVEYEDVLTKGLEAVKSAGSVTVMNLEVWSEGRNPCKKHCWHPVLTSPKHKIAAGDYPENHEDFICCGCTHGRCTVKANAVIDQ